MKRICALVFLGALSVLAADPSMAGNWKFTLNVNGESHELSCTFQQDAGKLTGACKGDNGDNALTGQIDGDKIAWKHEVPYNGDKLTLSYAGTLSSPTEIKGAVNVQPYDITGDFVGKKDATAEGK